MPISEITTIDFMRRITNSFFYWTILMTVTGYDNIIIQGPGRNVAINKQPTNLKMLNSWYIMLPNIMGTKKPTCWLKGHFVIHSLVPPISTKKVEIC